MVSSHLPDDADRIGHHDVPGSQDVDAEFSRRSGLVLEVVRLTDTDQLCRGAFRCLVRRQVGAVLGAGIEYGFTPNISAKLEYLYLTAASLDISHHSEIRLGLNYRFGGL